MMSVLARAGPTRLQLDPFPHLLLDDALDSDTYAELTASFPSLNVVDRRGSAPKNNHLYLLSANNVITNPQIAPRWREFFSYHVSPQFWREALALVKEPLLEIHPNLERLAERPLEDFRVAMRDAPGGSVHEPDIFLDCQFGLNSPVTRASSVRSPHLDRPTKLFNALLYCRAPDDPTPGGELILYRSTGPLMHGKGSSIVPTRVSAAKRIAYRPNRLVLFLNSPTSVHGVAPRPQTPHVRRYVNFLCEFKQPLFEVPRASRFVRSLESARAAGLRALGRGAAPLEEFV